MKNLLCAAALCCALSGCAGMNSDFDCNKTTTDQCLTMTEANKLAAKGKSLDDLSTEGVAKKSANEVLPALPNPVPAVSPNRPLSASTTAVVMAKPVVMSEPSTSALTGKPLPAPVIQPARGASDAGKIVAQRVPDATQRLWIAPWIDTDDNLHQPAVVEFVKNRSHWDQDFRVISEGDD